jgi:hypothetical protein
VTPPLFEEEEEDDDYEHDYGKKRTPDSFASLAKVVLP